MNKDLKTRFRQRIEAIDLDNSDARHRLNQAYSDLVGELRELFYSTSFSAAAPSLDEQGAKEASDPDSEQERLWELASHHPHQVAHHPIWGLLQLGGCLFDKNNSIPEEHAFPLAQLEQLSSEVQRAYPGRYHKIIQLSATALGNQGGQSSEKQPIFQNLHAAGHTPSDRQIADLLRQTDDFGSDTCLESAERAIDCLSSMSERFEHINGFSQDHADELLTELLPVFFQGEELFKAAMNRHGQQSIFMDAPPIADHLRGMSKTRLVNAGIHIYQDSVYPAEVYQRLSEHRNSGPQSEVAACRNTPPEVMAELAKSTSNQIIYPLACNPMTPLPVLNALLNWSGWGSKTAAGYVKKNPAYQQGELWQLSEMGRLIQEVDQRKKATLLDILSFLDAGENHAESLRVLLNAAVWSVDPLRPSQLRLRMIRNGWASEELLMAAAWSWHWVERLAVARAPHAPKQALEKLQNDGLPFVRHAAGQTRGVDAAPELNKANITLEALLAMAASDPVSCVQHPGFGRWLATESAQLAEALHKQHGAILKSPDLPLCYVEWQLSEGHLRDRLKLLMRSDIPPSLLHELVVLNKDGDLKMLGNNDEPLLASTIAGHINQADKSLQAASVNDLQKSDYADLTPAEIALFLNGFYRPDDLNLLPVVDQILILTHPAASKELLAQWNLANILKGWGSQYIQRVAMTYDQIDCNKDVDVAIANEGTDPDNLALIRCCCRLLQRSKSPRELVHQLLTSLIQTVSKMHPAELVGPNALAVLPQLPHDLLEALVIAKDPAQRLLAACCPNLNQEQLQALASDDTALVRQAIATRCDCPIPVLERLWSDSDRSVRGAVLRNPLCPSAVLVEVCSSANQHKPAVLKYPALPEALALQMRKTLGWLKNHVQSVACWSPALLEQLIQDMDEDALWDFCYDLEGNPWLNAETLSWMALSERDSRYRPRHLRQIAAAHRNTPMDVLECLASDELPDVRAAVAANPNCTAALFAQMADDRHTGEWDLEKTCSNPSYPVAWLQESMGAMDTDALASLTLHPHCPEDVLLSLLRDHRKTSNYGWRDGRALADIASRHPNLGCSSSLEVLQQFALDRFRSTTHSRAKRLALLSPHCPPALLKRHCNSLDWRERHAIASNPCTPRACLKQLQRDSNQHVRLAAASHTSSTH